MTKNEMIRVFDADGNEIGQTYPKRVQGLIKKGRARFTDDSETAIVLTDMTNENTEACPPTDKSEDIKMFEDTNTAEVLETITPAEESVTGKIPETMPEELRRLYDKLDDIDDEITIVFCDEPDRLMQSSLSRPVYLMALENNPNGITAPQLCELCRKDKADVSRTMAVMEKKGLVVKEGVHQNLYRGVFKLTEKGMELAQQVRRRATLAVKLAGKDLTDDARQVFYKSMDLIANNLRELCKDGLPPTSGHTKGDSRK